MLAAGIAASRFGFMDPAGVLRVHCRCFSSKQAHRVAPGYRGVQQ